MSAEWKHHGVRKMPQMARFKTFVHYKGARFSLKDACRLKGTSRQAVYYWRDKGLTLQEAFDKVKPLHER